MPHVGMINPFLRAPVVRVPPALTFSVSPSEPAGACWQMNTVIIQARDGMGSPDPTYNGPVTIALGTNPTGALLFGTLTVNASAGVATFDNWNIDRNGVGFTLIASTMTTTVTSTPFTITGASDTAVCSRRNYTNAPTFALGTARWAVIMTWWRTGPSLGTGFQGGQMITAGGSAGSISESGNGPTIMHRFNGSAVTSAGGSFKLFPDNVAGIIAQYSARSGQTYPAGPGPWHQDIVSYDTQAKSVQWMTDGVLLTLDFAFGPAAGPLVFNGIDSPQVVFSLEGKSSDSFIGLSNDHGLDLSDPETALLFRTLAGNPVDLSGGIPGYSTLAYLRGRSSGYLSDSGGSAGAFSLLGASIMENTDSTPWP